MRWAGAPPVRDPSVVGAAAAAVEQARLYRVRAVGQRKPAERGLGATGAIAPYLAATPCMVQRCLRDSRASSTLPDARCRAAEGSRAWARRYRYKCAVPCGNALHGPALPSRQSSKLGSTGCALAGSRSQPSVGSALQVQMRRTCRSSRASSTLRPACGWRAGQRRAWPGATVGAQISTCRRTRRSACAASTRRR